jgi:hypothetical protein
MAPYVIGAVIGVVLIAYLTVGRETLLLGRQPKQAVFDIEEAVEFVAERLPAEVTARVGYDDVRQLLRWHVLYLRARGVPRLRSETAGDDVVVEDDEGLAWVLREADKAGLGVADEDVAAVVAADFAYLEAIGAVGAPAAPPPADPPPAAPPPNGTNGRDRGHPRDPDLGI